MFRMFLTLMRVARRRVVISLDLPCMIRRLPPLQYDFTMLDPDPPLPFAIDFMISRLTASSIKFNFHSWPRPPAPNVKVKFNFKVPLCHFFHLFSIDNYI